MDLEDGALERGSDFILDLNGTGWGHVGSYKRRGDLLYKNVFERRWALTSFGAVLIFICVLLFCWCCWGYHKDMAEIVSEEVSLWIRIWRSYGQLRQARRRQKMEGLEMGILGREYHTRRQRIFRPMRRRVEKVEKIDEETRKRRALIRENIMLFNMSTSTEKEIVRSDLVSPDSEQNHGLKTLELNNKISIVDEICREIVNANIINSTSREESGILEKRNVIRIVDDIYGETIQPHSLVPKTFRQNHPSKMLDQRNKISIVDESGEMVGQQHKHNQGTTNNHLQINEREVENEIFQIQKPVKFSVRHLPILSNEPNLQLQIQNSTSNEELLMLESYVNSPLNKFKTREEYEIDNNFRHARFSECTTSTMSVEHANQPKIKATMSDEEKIFEIIQFQKRLRHIEKPENSKRDKYHGESDSVTVSNQPLSSFSCIYQDVPETFV